MKDHISKESGKKAKNGHHHHLSFDVASARVDQKAFTVFVLFFMAFCVSYFVVCLCK